MNNNKTDKTFVRPEKDELVEAYGRKCSSLLDKLRPVSVLFAGVGGQGIILATTVLSLAALYEGFDVKVSEVHGMAQRGGSVIGSVRFGQKVFSPTVGKADFLIAFEKLEALRYLGSLKEEGLLLVNDHSICPTTVYLEDRQYPGDIEDRIAKAVKNYIMIEAVSIAEDLGEIRAANMVLLGQLSNFLPIKAKSWIKSIEDNVPAKAISVNIEAFDTGKEM